MGPAFRRERHAAGGAGNDKSRILIAGLIERIESACHERVVDCTDRTEAFSKQAVGQACRAQQLKQMHLGNAELNVLALRRELPFLRGGNLLITEGVALIVTRKQAAPINPRTDIGGHGDIW